MKAFPTPFWVVTEEKAREIRSNWLRKAGVELVFWVPFATLCYAFGRGWLDDWPFGARIEFFAFTLVLCSRAAIWIGLFTLFVTGLLMPQQDWQGDGFLFIVGAVFIRFMGKAVLWWRRVDPKGTRR